MGKTLIITDDVYYELVKMKGEKSISEFLRELLGKEKKGNLDVLMIGFASMSEDDAKELENKIREVEEWLDSWTPVS